MAETLLNSSIITREVMMVLAEKMQFLKRVNRQYDSQYAREGGKIGSSLQIRKPSRGAVRTGRVMDLQDKVDLTTTLTVANQWGIDLGASSSDMALKIDDFRERYIEPKVTDLVAAIEARVLADSMPYINAVAGDYGAFDDWSTVLDANRFLNDQLAPRDNRTLLVGNKAEATCLDAFKGFYNHQALIGKQYEDGRMGVAAGFDWISSSLVPTITRGTANGSYVLNGVPTATGDSAITVATGSGTLKAGDVITIAGVNACHPQTKADLGYLMPFTVTADYAGGAGDVSVSPAYILTGPEQNVYAAPASNAAVTVKGTSGTAYAQNLAFCKDAIAFVTADLPLPPKKDATRMSHGGISLRYINDYDSVNDMFISRVDVLWGSAVIRPELACRVPSTL